SSCRFCFCWGWNWLFELSCSLCNLPVSRAMNRYAGQLDFSGSAAIMERSIHTTAATQHLLISMRNSILHHMVHYKSTQLDDSFAALSDVTRRGVLEQLARS